VGINHRVGPNRCWVELARALAADGYASLRIDLSGLGDSRPRRDIRSDADRAVLDLREALDWLIERSIAQSAVLVGNCSGVDSLHGLAKVDPRVGGAVYIDGYAYRNSGHAWRHWLYRPFQIARWRRRLRRALGKGWTPATGAEVWAREYPSREEFARDVEAIVGRGAKLLFIFTSNMDSLYNHELQFHETFGHRDTVEVAFYPLADHLFSTTGSRLALVERVCSWMRRGFP
jgi:pimeloyl-ACP methyl ester carboxylesterase